MILEIDAGLGAPVRLDLGSPNAEGDLDATDYGGNVYLSCDGQLYGSIYVRYDHAAQQHVVTLGQFDPEIGSWEARNPIGPEDSYRQ